MSVLYPPIIGASIPACYKDGTSIKISVPFSMNRAVSTNSFTKFSLKIKTVQSNRVIDTISSTVNETQTFISNRVVDFYWEESNKFNFDEIKEGQYLKVQMAYANGNDVGYYSTVATLKYTSKPKVYIAVDDSNGILSFQDSYVGVYELGADVSERPYAYNFFLYNSENGLLEEESGWQLHDSSLEADQTVLSKTHDTYSFETNLEENKEYFIQYGVRTINNLEVYSKVYTCVLSGVSDIDLNSRLIAENIFEEGYILLQLKKNDNAGTTLSDSISIEISRAEVGNLTTISDGMDLVWRNLKKIYFAAGTLYTDIERTIIKDYTIEQGVHYCYRFRQYNAEGVYSSSVYSNVVEADFEDMFLYDGELQLKVRFNPKVSSFKTTRQEQKIDTIGNKFPFLFRNGIVEYKEFPIGGLISYLADNNNEFLKAEDDLDIIRADSNVRREKTPTQNEAYQKTQTLDSIGYNMRAERKFKLKLLDWLGNGKIKLFKSPAEGNYLIKLMNVSLTPEDKLGRMIHSFSATAYEIEELTYKNLIELGFIKINQPTTEAILMASAQIIEILNSAGYTQDPLITSVAPSIKLNALGSIVNNFTFSFTANPGDRSFYVRIGKDDADHRVLLSQSFNMEIAGDLPDVWINLADNNITDYQTLQTIFADVTFTYSYQNTRELIGNISNIHTMTIRNVIQSIMATENNEFVILNSNIQEQDGQIRTQIRTLQYYVLSFKYRNENQVVLSSDDPAGKIIFTFSDDSEVVYNTIPTINLSSNSFIKPIKSIQIGAIYQLDYACRQEVITYNIPGGENNGGE